MRAAGSDLGKVRARQGLNAVLRASQRPLRPAQGWLRLRPTKTLQRWLVLLLAVLLALLNGVGPGGRAVSMAGSATPGATPPADTAPSAAPAAERRSPGPTLRKVPGASPAQTIDHFLALTAEAESTIRAAVHQGLATPGPFFAPQVHQQVDGAIDQLQQATQALDLSQVPVALRPMSGVGTMLMLRSLLSYDLHQNPGLVIPDAAAVRQEHLRSWTLPGSPISLEAISGTRGQLRQACGQCSSGDYLFSADTLAQVPEDFERIFSHDHVLSRRFSADLYTYWALMPGGALPPKLLFQLPVGARRTLLTVIGGQSLLQWLLLIPATLLALALMLWWFGQMRRWQRRHAGPEGPLPHLISVLAVVPPLLLVWGWEWYSIDWVNLIGPRQEGVLIASHVLQGLLKALLVYLAMEAIGQLISYRRVRTASAPRRHHFERRKGSGQILTITRVVGLVGSIVVCMHTGRDLGMTSLTLIALSSVPALAISLGTQQLIHDIADGFSILLDGQIKPGDACTISTSKSGEIKGLVRSLGMRSMRLQQEDGSVLSIPNSQVASSVVTNHQFRSNTSLKLSLKLPNNTVEVLQQQLQAVRAHLADCTELEHGKAELDITDQTWRLKVTGEWSASLSTSDQTANREALLLHLLKLTQT